VGAHPRISRAAQRTEAMLCRSSRPLRQLQSLPGRMPAGATSVLHSWRAGAACAWAPAGGGGGPGAAALTTAHAGRAGAARPGVAGRLGLGAGLPGGQPDVRGRGGARAGRAGRGRARGARQGCQARPKRPGGKRRERAYLLRACGDIDSHDAHSCGHACLRWGSMLPYVSTT